MEFNPDLLLEVARLARKYSTDEWRNLLVVLKDDSALKTLIEVAETMSKPQTRKRASIYAEAAGAPTRQPPITALLQKLKADEPEKAEVLKKFRTLALSRQLFESTADLRDFAVSCGLKVSSAEDREKVVNDLIRTLAGMKIEELKEKMSSFTVQRSNLSQDYERWVKIILGKTE